jgi:predicted nucleotidyltransferase
MKKTSVVTSNPVLPWEQRRPEVTDELLSDITRRIVDAFHPYKIILFGSYAYGKPHIYSDVDLFVIMDSEERMVPRIRRVSEVAHVDFCRWT